jgi:hypothetical protein
LPVTQSAGSFSALETGSLLGCSVGVWTVIDQTPLAPETQ